MPSLGLRRKPSASDATLWVFALASVVAFLRADGSGVLGGLPVLALAVTLDHVDDRLRLGIERLAWLAVLLSALAAVAWTFYWVLDEEQLVEWRGVLGPTLVVFSAVFLSGQRVWSASRGLVPISLALLVLSAVGPGERVTLPLAVATCALLAWLVIDRPSPSTSPLTAGARGGLILGYAGASVAVSAAIISALPVAQPMVERATRDFLSDRTESGLSESGALGAVAQIGLSRDVVLRVWSDRPGLMRARVHTDFDGRQWSSRPSGVRRLEPSTDAQPLEVRAVLDDLPGVSFAAETRTAGDVRAMKVLLARAGRGWVVTPPGARTLRVAGGTPTIDGAGVFKAPFNPPPTLYGLAIATPEPGTLASTERATLVAVPDGLDPRMSELADRIGAGSLSDRERVDATVAWLRECCTYALDVGAFATDQPVSEFLFDKRRGYCEYFASAAALLLRLQGVPTRYVTGLSVRADNRRGDHYLVRGSDAHAWIEVWVDGEGWVEIDPTPADQYAALRSDLTDGWVGRAFEALAGSTAEVAARFAEDWTAALGWLGSGMVRFVTQFGWWLGSIPIVGGLAALLLALLRRRRSGGRPAPPGLEPAVRSRLAPKLARLLDRLEERWDESGHARPAHRAHLEHLSSLEPGAISPELEKLSWTVVDCYYRAHFGGQKTDSVELDRLWGALR